MVLLGCQGFVTGFLCLAACGGVLTPGEVGLSKDVGGGNVSSLLSEAISGARARGPWVHENHRASEEKAHDVLLSATEPQTIGTMLRCLIYIDL